MCHLTPGAPLPHRHHLLAAIPHPIVKFPPAPVRGSVAPADEVVSIGEDRAVETPVVVALEVAAAAGFVVVADVAGAGVVVAAGVVVVTVAVAAAAVLTAAAAAAVLAAAVVGGVVVRC